jgi:hypothetical protein
MSPIHDGELLDFLIFLTGLLVQDGGSRSLDFNRSSQESFGALVSYCDTIVVLQQHLLFQRLATTFNVELCHERSMTISNCPWSVVVFSLRCVSRRAVELSYDDSLLASASADDFGAVWLFADDGSLAIWLRLYLRQPLKQNACGNYVSPR